MAPSSFRDRVVFPLPSVFRGRAEIQLFSACTSCSSTPHCSLGTAGGPRTGQVLAWPSLAPRPSVARGSVKWNKQQLFRTDGRDWGALVPTPPRLRPRQSTSRAQPLRAKSSDCLCQ
ncbi:unnamed protein product [Prorocentrum cordatum]|uniref:Uncharacterized protein n=1 Tax=Prorocentrum cordatum TaxID=2364126 RepID=A0ABN9RJB6_9DINO|nr:unnamed protein product [Polarella glacialis]